MAKNFSLNLKKDPHSTTPKHDDAGTSAAVPEETPKHDDAGNSAANPAEEPKARKKIGRPKVKEGEYKTINISVPVNVLQKMEVAKLKYGSNLTAYVNAVIKADLDANYDKYLELQNILNS